MALGTYDPNQISLIVGGKIITGFSDGTFITASRDEDAFSLKVGVKGDAVRAKNNNRSGKIVFSLLQNSPSNDDLSAFVAADQLSGTGVVPFLMKDNSGRTLASALNSWIQKVPDTEFSKDVSTRSWTLQTNDIELFVGGN